MGLKHNTGLRHTVEIHTYHEEKAFKMYSRVMPISPEVPLSLGPSDSRYDCRHKLCVTVKVGVC